MTCEDGSDEEEMDPGIETLVAEKTEQVHDARAEALMRRCFRLIGRAN